MDGEERLNAKPVYATETPPCEHCGLPLDDLNLALLAWDRFTGIEKRAFDGFHFFHKRCRDGHNRFAAFLEVATIIATPGEWAAQQAALLAVFAIAARRPEHHRAAIAPLLWLSRLETELRAAEVAQQRPLALLTGVELDSILDATLQAFPRAA